MCVQCHWLASKRKIFALCNAVFFDSFLRSSLTHRNSLRERGTIKPCKLGFLWQWFGRSRAGRRANGLEMIWLRKVQSTVRYLWEVYLIWGRTEVQNKRERRKKRLCVPLVSSFFRVCSDWAHLTRRTQSLRMPEHHANRKEKKW